MDNPLLVLAAIIMLGLLYVLFPVFLDVLARYRKSRTITCPQNSQKASVQVDAGRAALTSLAGKPTLHIENCSMWDGEMYCEQQCRSQL